MSKTLFIKRGNNVVSFYINELGFNGYTLRQAIKKYREDHGLKYKHLEIIDLR